MDYRHLGGSGMLVSAIAYGNWVTHGSQVDQDAATACVRAALYDTSITTFDTADVYAETRAEEALGAALKGVRREGVRDLHQGVLPDRARGRTNAVCPASASSIDQRLAAPPGHGLRGPVPGSPLRLRHSARGDDGGPRRCRPRGRGALHRRLGVEATEIRATARAGTEDPSRVPTACCGA